MPNAKLVRFDSVNHEERRPGVILSSLVDGSTGATQISSGVAEFAAGASAPTHYHDAEESVIVIEGEGLMVINGEEHIVRPNDAAFISPGAHHSIANHGNQPFKIAWSYASINWSTTAVE
ncbi:MAG: cupin domain-containing protein [SAR202 cluster bacterium]|nr:cupin domain-containing protein [SAR202 cluster bacterium]